MTAARAPRGADAGAAVISARGIVAGYVPGVDILRGCDLELARGEIVGVIGPNGAGKSTLLKALFGLVPIRRGQVLLEGQDISGVPPHELVGRGVGYVPQVANVFPSLSVDENLRMGLYLEPGAWDERHARIAAIFPLLGERGRQRAGLLSGGERQMLAMARALMMDPAVLLLDEPSAGLSPLMQNEVFSRIGEINRSGTSIVMVEQNARRCLELCHRGYVLDQGGNAHTGTGPELLEDARVVELYLGSLARAR